MNFNVKILFVYYFQIYFLETFHQFNLLEPFANFYNNL
jgi:hypothetical protein